MHIFRSNCYSHNFEIETYLIWISFFSYALCDGGRSYETHNNHSFINIVDQCFGGDFVKNFFPKKRVSVTWSEGMSACIGSINAITVNML